MLAINKIISDGYVCDHSFYIEYAKSIAAAKIEMDGEFEFNDQEDNRDHMRCGIL